MSKHIKIAILISLCSSFWPLISLAQTCYNNISATTFSGQYTDHGDGTITDTKTGLMWKKCSEGQTGEDCDGKVQIFNWQQALQQADALNVSGGFAGKTDWRVPNIKELRSLLELQCISPPINLSVFPATPTTATYSGFWSSSPAVINDSYAWITYFSRGHSSWDYKSKRFSIRLVRNDSDF